MNPAHHPEAPAIIAEYLRRIIHEPTPIDPTPHAYLQFCADMGADIRAALELLAPSELIKMGATP